MKNRRIVLAARPTGEVKPSDLRLEEAPVPEPGVGEVLLRTRLLSLDPYMRGRMNPGKSYAPALELGDVMVGSTIAEVVSSHHPDLSPGDPVLSYSGWQDYALANGQELRKLNPSLAPLSTALGVLGMPGLTAYTGLLTIGKPQAGETVVVAAATGPVGSVVGQVAKIKGCRVVGIAGGPEKCQALIEEFGFDAAIDHRAPGFGERLTESCPKGIDVYFENVGGAVWDAVFPLLNDFARIPVCGLVAHYNDAQAPQGPDRLPGLMGKILVQRLTLRGFIVSDFADQEPAFLHDMTTWLREDKIRYREDIVEGLEAAPQALIGLLRGKNFGKLLVRVSPSNP